MKLIGPGFEIEVDERQPVDVTWEIGKITVSWRTGQSFTVLSVADEAPKKN